MAARGRRSVLAKGGWLVALTAAVLAPHASRAHDGEAVSYMLTPGGYVSVSLPDTGERGPLPVVLVLPDALGPDRRSKAYTDALNANGVATVELLPVVEDGNGAPPALPEDAPAGILAALAADPRFDASRLGVLAFGAGGATALRSPSLAGTPTALLYPGCPRLAPPPTDRPLLVLHGGMDHADRPGACAEWAAAAGPLARRHEYIHATYGWDFSAGRWPDGLTLLPSPGEEERRVWARADAATTADAALRVTDFLVEALDSVPGMAMR